MKEGLETAERKKGNGKIRIVKGEKKMLEIRRQRESRKERTASSWEKCVKRRSPLPYNESHPPRMRGTYPVLPCSKEVDLEIGLGQSVQKQEKTATQCCLRCIVRYQDRKVQEVEKSANEIH